MIKKKYKFGKKDLKSIKILILKECGHSRQSYQDISLEDIMQMLDVIHKKHLYLTTKLDEKILFERIYYPGTKTSNLSAYFIGNGPSHYEWAIKKIKKHLKLIKSVKEGLA